MDRNWEEIAAESERTDRRGRRAFMLGGVTLSAVIGAAALWAGMAPARAGAAKDSAPATNSTSPRDRTAPAVARSAPGTPAAKAAVPALTVQVTSPRQVTMARTLVASGSVAARDELLVAADAQGVRLVQVGVEVGHVVRRGQLLALGDDAQLQAQLAQAEAQIRDKRAELAQAEANLERAERIKDSGVYSAEAVQTRRTAAESAAARLDLVLAQKRELEVRIAHTRVLAPADGVIVGKSATVGTVMQPGMELFRLIRGGEIEWRAELPDHALTAIQPGTVARVRIDETRNVDGRVRLVAPTVDVRSRNGLVHVTLPAGTPLRAGGHAQGELQLGEAQVWTLPEAALLSRDGHALVYVIGDDGTATAQRVATGARRGGLVEVRGLAPDTRVVATGAGFVKEGERVRVAGPDTGPGLDARPTAGPAAPTPGIPRATPAAGRSPQALRHGEALQVVEVRT